MREGLSLLTPTVERHLLVDEGEVIVDEVIKHPVTAVLPVTAVVAGVAVMMVAGVAGWWPVILVGLALSLGGLYRYHARYMDRFVITNMRVFRVRGVFSRQVATMPLSRILDINLRQPLLGMILGYAHFTFESAADYQGMRDITYVGRPRERDLTIQRVIQRSGIRAVSQTGDGT
ncbi:MAG: PH domain-containing protein [Propionibacteriaceae bacterium]|jgi:uncharacterized membrane protein YdbT with pleckstrin-like domain|nr:PH domain-containing protein [Propionibacteriaceae bacterium]